MRHVNYELTPKKIDAAKPAEKAYTLTDGGGLYIEVMPGGSKVWRFKYHLDGARPKVTIGHYPAISVRDARDKHEQLRAMVERGENPAAVLKAGVQDPAPRTEPTVREYAEKWIGETMGHLSPSYVAAQTSYLNDDVYPEIGGMLLSEVQPEHVLKIIDKRRSTPSTAERIRVVVQQMFNHAIRNLAVKFNPATPLRGAVVVPPKEHHLHLTESQLGEFWRVVNLQGAHPQTVFATQLLMLTMARKMELLKARRKEFDLDQAIWEVPAERMKMRRPHRVYLPTQAVALLRILMQLTADGGPEGYLFRSAYAGRQASHMADATLNHFFARMDFGVAGFSPHGTRGTAATLLREHGFRKDVTDLLLAHQDEATSAAYHHHELPAERREALQFLADRIDQLHAAAVAAHKAKRALEAPAVVVEPA